MHIVYEKFPEIMELKLLIYAGNRLHRVTKIIF